MSLSDFADAHGGTSTSATSTTSRAPEWPQSRSGGGDAPDAPAAPPAPSAPAPAAAPAAAAALSARASGPVRGPAPLQCQVLFTSSRSNSRHYTVSAVPPTEAADAYPTGLTRHRPLLAHTTVSHFFVPPPAEPAATGADLPSLAATVAACAAYGVSADALRSPAPFTTVTHYYVQAPPLSPSPPPPPPKALVRKNQMRALAEVFAVFREATTIFATAALVSFCFSLVVPPRHP
ncbi:hypothetical protein GPECTOR_18g34 [Gonium pectorale]|uniref:Uncharacterized protein n=1 Tax=Gonium pectorale TaxID=33097 RepID=A0A150GJW5_GONPE|nr:hypothetical protein GPECTOR_18g34 [Gonium pectorale]|eukprot:KXZ50054.1 hypothetical protein GPECTOR_18g34 [Gonium pectorale]